MSHLKRKLASRHNFMNNILDDVYHPDEPICHIISTSTKSTKKTKCDLFKQYRPVPGTCLDYNISQTDAKLDAGPTKIHIQQTHAEYVGLSDAPPPPPPKKIKYFSGGPPCWEFIDEIYKRKMAESQKFFRKMFGDRVALRKKAERGFLMKRHHEIMALVGPEWYQELSPKQIEKVDNLKSCMNKDYLEGVTCHTSDNLSDLGLVLRPCSKHLEKALKNCCKCPIEFLLILYQLINPKRKKYSINDRLLLSAVVHLTLKDTLKELHIRIPSPPPPQVEKKTKPKKKKYPPVASPYLEPYTFERPPPKFSGIYYNKHVQYPESPYFSYLDDLKKRIQSGDDQAKTRKQSFEVKDEEIENEMKLAQSIYENLVDYKPVPRLLKPSRYGQCYNFRNKPKLPISATLKTLPRSLDEEEIICMCKKERELRRKLKRRMARIKVREESFIIGGVVEKPEGPVFLISGLQPEIQYEVGRKRRKGMKDLLQFPIYKEETLIIGGVTETKDGPVFIISGLQQATEKEVCTCGKDYQLLERRKELIRQTLEQEQKYILGGVANTPEGPVFVLSGVQTERITKESELRKREEFVRAMIERRKKFVIDGVVDTPEGPVFLLSRLQPDMEWGVEDEYERQDVAVEESTAESQQFCNIVDFNPEESASESSTNEEQKRCKCLQKQKLAELEKSDRLREEEAARVAKEEAKCNEGDEGEKKDQEICECREESRKFIETPLCPCERCEEKRRKLTTTYVIQGMKEVELDEVVPVIDSVVSEQPCTCLKNYEKKVGDYESYQKRKELVVSTLERKEKFVVGGVAVTPEGPVFVHQGIQPKLRCICADIARKEEEERRHLAMMPRVPPGRIKYGIGGVKETPQGNVYIINNTIPIDDCQCMKVYEQFRKEHDVCLQLYEDYLNQMKEEINEFMNEFLVESRRSTRRETFAEDESREISGSNLELEAVEEINLEGGDTYKEICCKNVVLPPPPCCTCGQVECKLCSCGGEVEVPCVDCTCAPDEQEEEEISEGVEEEEEEDEKTKLKRVFIFKKIPCSKSWQLRVLKKALKSMAEDGYPLAKLPDCYKLPHFRLWMLMRCGKFWTQEAKSKSVLISKSQWRHTDVCTVRNIRRTNLPLTKEEARAFDWSKADAVRKLTNETINQFYRKLKQNMVEVGREFFPTCFEYNFPFKTFRDCYFAYTPSKEEDVYPRFVWQPYQYKNMADARHCCL